VRVAVALENRDGIDGHRHGTPLECTGNLSGVVVGRLVRTHRSNHADTFQGDIMTGRIQPMAKEVKFMANAACKLRL
jgi:hypothetical protein